MLLHLTKGNNCISKYPELLGMAVNRARYSKIEDIMPKQYNERKGSKAH